MYHLCLGVYLQRLKKNVKAQLELAWLLSCALGVIIIHVEYIVTILVVYSQVSVLLNHKLFVVLISIEGSWTEPFNYWVHLASLLTTGSRFHFLSAPPD